MNSVYMVLDRKMESHECPWETYHIEVPRRLSSIIDNLEEKDYLKNVKLIPTRLAEEDEIRMVHTKRYVDAVKMTRDMSVEEQEEFCKKYEDIYVNKSTFDVALMAAAASIDISLKCFKEKSNGFALIRPPGHHAMPDEGCGFCIFNNIAIAAKNVIKCGAEKVLIVDFDVHAGQGTQECIADNDKIKLISIHRYEDGEFWPNLEQSGIKHSFKNTINVPLNGTGFGDSEYLAIFSLIVMPIIYEYQPELILVSCGFDAALGDPEGFMRVTPAGYATFMRMLMRTGIPVCALLEGGYFIESVVSGSEWVLKSLLNEKIPRIELNSVHHKVAEVIHLVQRVHGEDFKIFRKILNVSERLNQNIKQDADLMKFKGIRTVCVPFDTRGIYEPLDEQIVNINKRELEEILKSYKEIKDVPQTGCSAECKNFLMELLIKLPSDPNAILDNIESDGPNDIDKVVETLNEIKNDLRYKNLPIFSIPCIEI